MMWPVCIVSPDRMLCHNMDTIQAKFVSLLQTVQKALEANEVSIANVYQFLNQWLITKCQPELDAACRTEFSIMFNCLTKRKVWTCEYYKVLEILTEKFLSDIQAIKGQITQYKSDLSGFFIATKLIEFYIKLRSLFAEGLDNKVSPLNKHTKEEYRSLKVILNLGSERISEQSLKYVRDLWEKLTEEVNLPQLAKRMKEIVPGSLEITWIIWSRMAEIITEKSITLKAIIIFRKHNITLVAVDDVTVYDEQQLVS